MYSTRFLFLSASALFLSFAIANPNSTCNTFGIDFVDGNTYFINTLSNDDFTCVSQFEGCNTDVADVLLVDPTGEEYLCSDIPTTPDDTSQMSTCPIEKSQMVSGLWRILVLGNNGDGNPLAAERDVTLDCGPQATTTVTATATYNITSTPTSTITVLSTIVTTSTFGPNTTYTLPSKTAHRTITITPPPVTSTKTKVFTRHRMTWTKSQTIKTKTVTASCTIPSKPEWPDKRCTYTPTLIHPKAFATNKPHRYTRRMDRAIDVEYARSRIEAAKLKRDLKAKAIEIEERAPDAPTLTITAPQAINTTITYTAPGVSTTETDLTTSTVSTTLPPSTVYSGKTTSTITLPPKTKTRYSVSYTTQYTTKTIVATWTKTTTVTPPASATACKKQGGHWGGGFRW